MILDWPDSDESQRRERTRKEERFQRAMARQRAKTGNHYFTFFAVWPMRISDTKVVWLDWFEACPVGMLHGTLGRHNGFASLRARSAWRYRTKPESFWRWLARTGRDKIHDKVTRCR